jgi:D-aminoacyl-tRNA deacylase
MVLVSSTRDPASTNISTVLKEKLGFASTGVKLLGNAVYQKESLLLATFDEEIVHPPNLDTYFNPKGYIFLSRHSAASGIPTLTAHMTGNFSEEAELGGNPRELARVDPDLLKNYMIALSKRITSLPGYQMSVEGTHHGPTSLTKPVLFIEIGSSEKNWSDPAAGRATAEALVESLSERQIWEKVAIALGGTHYSDKFNKLLVEGDMALAAVVPRYALEHFDSEMLGQLLQKSTSPIRYAALDWKGLGPHKDKVNKLCAQFGLEVVRV